MSNRVVKAVILFILITLFVACRPVDMPMLTSSTVNSADATVTPILLENTPASATAISLPLTGTPVPPPADATAPPPGTVNQGFLLKDVGFKTPESVCYDPEADVYLVANINGAPSSEDNNGFISRISPDGEIIALKWIDSMAEGVTPFTLNAPKGMALSGDYLFVADIDIVRVFDREKGTWLGEIPVEGARFLNDVTAAQDGKVYVTDSDTGIVHLINLDWTVEQIARLENPNGIQVVDETILVIGGSNQIFQLSKDGTLTLKYQTPAGGLDGLIILDDGSVLVSSWAGSAVYRFDGNGQMTELFSGVNAPADIGFDIQRRLVLIPYFEDDWVEARPLSPIQTTAQTDSSTLPSTPTVMPYVLTRDLPYITGGYPQQKLDIYLPTSGNGPFFTLLLIHGGGGDKQDLAFWAQHFVELDYAVISINYRDTRFGYPAPVQDAFCALAWTHSQADTYGFDPQHIVALGHSVGGTLTAMLGTVDDVDLFTESCPLQLPGMSWIQGVISFTGIFDYVSAVQFSPERRSRLEVYFGAKLEQASDIWAEASAATWVDGSEPPFLLVHGLEDITIEPEQSVNFAEILEQAGVNVELLLIPGADHGEILSSERSFKAVEDFLAHLDHDFATTYCPQI
jgi:acetyl esterase/lipase/DNA-binding beta-propeller fold protein YncE